MRVWTVVLNFLQLIQICFGGKWLNIYKVVTKGIDYQQISKFLVLQYIGNKAKRRISKRVFQENKIWHALFS